MLIIYLIFLICVKSEYQYFFRELLQRNHVDEKVKYGAPQFDLHHSVFVVNSGAENSTLGKVFAIRLLEEMNSLGYDPMLSSDLSRTHDQSTIFFKQTGFDSRYRPTIMCIAPGQSDRLIVTKGDENVIAGVRDVILQSWPKGIQKEEKEPTKWDTPFEFKLSGNPWVSTNEESTACRALLADLIAKMGFMRWRFYVSVNLKGGTDVFFFIKDEDYTCMEKDFGVLSLNRKDRIRLIKFGDEVKASVQQCIEENHKTTDVEEKDYHGAVEYKLKGSPFAASGMEAIATRRLLCRLLETLRNKGWEVLSAFDISRKLTDKSIFIMQRVSTVRTGVKFASVALSSSDTLRLIDFPSDVRQPLRNLIEKQYKVGIQKETTPDDSTLELQLSGRPWTMNTACGLHSRYMLSAVILEAEKRGWKLMASADVSSKYVHQENGPDYPLDVHSWFFCKEQTKFEQSDNGDGM